MAIKAYIYKGVTYPAVPKPMLAELRAAEKHFEADSVKFTAIEQIFSAIWIAAKRVKPGAVTWEEIDQSTEDDFDFVQEEKAPGAEAEFVDNPLDDVDPTGKSSGSTSPEPDHNQLNSNQS